MHQFVRLAAPALVFAALQGCVVAPPPQRVVVREEVRVPNPPPPPERVVVREEVRVVNAPPPPRVETPPAPPAPNFYWVGGHWRWDGREYLWEPGHWVEPRVNETWVPERWVETPRGWMLQPGHWARVAPPPQFVEVVAPAPPPPPRVEVMVAAPGPGFFWIPGVWRWEGGRHVWVPGRWERHRDGEHWVPHHWVNAGGQWRMTGGFWMRG